MGTYAEMGRKCKYCRLRRPFLGGARSDRECDNCDSCASAPGRRPRRRASICNDRRASSQHRAAFEYRSNTPHQTPSLIEDGLVPVVFCSCEHNYVPSSPSSQNEPNASGGSSHQKWPLLDIQRESSTLTSRNSRG